jgi:hypothetical protein
VEDRPGRRGRGDGLLRGLERLDPFVLGGELGLQVAEAPVELGALVVQPPYVVLRPLKQRHEAAIGGWRVLLHGAGWRQEGAASILNCPVSVLTAAVSVLRTVQLPRQVDPPDVALRALDPLGAYLAGRDPPAQRVERDA